MNRQEAAIIIKAIGKHAIETHLTDPGDILDATVMAVEALVPKPDEVTGLVPCGCGGRAKQEDFFDGFFYFGAIKCPECEIEIRIPSITPEESSDRVKVAWNRAMGYSPATQKGAST